MALSNPPDQRTRLVVDEYGSHLVFVGRECKTCGIGLTSRNRYGAYLYCSVHGREAERRQRQTLDPNRPRVARSPSKTARAAARAALPDDPILKGLRACFTQWLSKPNCGAARSILQQAMNEYELVERLRAVIPASLPPTIQGQTAN